VCDDDDDDDDDDDTTTMASFTRLTRDIYHARDILIKCDDTPRSIRTMRVWIHLALTPTLVDNDITCSPLSSCPPASLPPFLPHSLSLSLLWSQSLPRIFLSYPAAASFSLYFFFLLSDEHRRPTSRENNKIAGAHFGMKEKKRNDKRRTNDKSLVGT